MTSDSDPLLIVDDDSTVCDVVAALAETLGYSTVRALTGTEALGIVSQREVAAVLLDIAMPDMTGETVAATMLERGINPPLVIMTGMVTDTVQAFVDEDPARRCILAKPFMRSDLQTALDTVLASGKPTA